MKMVDGIGALADAAARCRIPEKPQAPNEEKWYGNIHAHREALNLRSDEAAGACFRYNQRADPYSFYGSALWFN
ncbi:MAG TPA: hypothetical protein H9671_02195 [Firmicutes bacterium]|nr:hypothetical protein [Bacillota bacterium]